jgi:uncharacterized protein involved in exopolysaccharide biosynthesis
MEIHRTTFLGFTLLLAGLAVFVTGVWQLSRPAQYQATAVIKVEPERYDIGSFLNETTLDVYGPYFIQTEFEALQSQMVLGRVVNSLNLNAKWSGKYAGGGTLTTNAVIAILKRNLRVALVRNTKLIEMSYISEDPEEAAKVANAIASAYQDYRVQKRKQETLNGLQVLQEEYLAKEQNIQIRHTNQDFLRKKLKIQDDDLSSSGSYTTGSLQFDSRDTNNVGLLTSQELEQRPYWEEKRKLDNMIAFHKLLQSKIAALKMDLATTSVRPMVEIVDTALLPELPAGPNRFLGAALLVIGLFTTVGGLLLLKSSRRPSV